MATATATRAPGWYVGCEDYQSGPFASVTEAEAAREHMETPRVCWNEHTLDFVAPLGVRVRLVKQYSTWTGHQFRQYERADSGQRVDVLVRLGRDQGMRAVRSNAEAKADAMLKLA